MIDNLTVIFRLLGSGHVKASCKTLLKSTPDRTDAEYEHATFLWRNFDFAEFCANGRALYRQLFTRQRSQSFNWRCELSGLMKSNFTLSCQKLFLFTFLHCGVSTRAYIGWLIGWSFIVSYSETIKILLQNKKNLYILQVKDEGEQFIPGK